MMSELSAQLPPFYIFLIGALLVAITSGWLRVVVLIAIPFVGFVNLLGFDHGSYSQVALFDYTLTFVRVDKLSILFGYLFHLAALLGILYSLHVRHDTTQQAMGILYAGSALGAIFAGDLITLFVFWELLAITSVFLVWARGTERAYRAGMRYLIIQVIAGVVLLAGILVHIQQTGKIDFEFMGLNGLASSLILFAFGVKACFPMLHNWLTDAYPEATPSGTVFLSAFTTKVAVYALARAFPGTEILVYVGGAMAMFPIFFAVIENDLRRVLAYSLINQVGFMVVGIGLGTELGINGAVSHAFNDVVFKGLLFMTMGAVLYRTGEMRGSHLGGLYKSMPWTTTFCIVGAASISAFPLFSGFVSKSMVMVSALEEGHSFIWLALLFASAGVFHHAGIKIPFFAFFAHDSGIRCKEAPWNMLLAMGIASAICIFNGSYPALLYSLLPFETTYNPYDATHVLAQMQILFFSALAFVWLNLTHRYPPELPCVNLDFEWLYRKMVPTSIKGMLTVFAPINSAIRKGVLAQLDRFIERVFHHHGPQGVLARNTTTGSTVLWVAILLAGYLMVYYI
jgi:multicomponent Na+:H+ antiporter subunit D